MWPRRIGARAWMAAVAALAIVLVFVSGCGKDDEPLLPPVIGDPQGSPDDAWQCLQRSLDSHTGEAWSDAIGLDFQYVPDSASAANHPHRFDAWSRATELAFVGALFAATVDFEAQMLPTEFAVPRPQGSQVMWTEVPYSVRVDGRGTGIAVVYRGIADLEFRLEGSLWYLHRWVDLRGQPAPWSPDVICPTFGELRARYGSH